MNEENSKCPNCKSENLTLLLETPKGFRYKCGDCEETFVKEEKLIGEDIKDITVKKEKEIDETNGKKTIKIPKRSYLRLESIKRDLGYNTTIDTIVHVIDMYEIEKELKLEIIKFLNMYGKGQCDMLEKFLMDIKNELKKSKETQEQQEEQQGMNVIWHF